MKKFIMSFIIGTCISFCFVGCTKEVTDEEITLNLSLLEQTTYTGKYTGTIDNDIPNGKGKFVSQDESFGNWYYEGDFIDGHFSGEGKLVIEESKKSYEGTFNNDELSSGKEFINNIIKYDGEFKGYEFNGKGKYYGLDGILEYDGEYKNGKRNGYGKIYDKDGSLLYEGEFEYGAPISQ